MGSNTIQILIAMAVYMAVVIGIGLIYAKRANKNSEEYFLGGRARRQGSGCIKQNDLSLPAFREAFFVVLPGKICYNIPVCKQQEDEL